MQLNVRPQQTSNYYSQCRHKYDVPIKTGWLALMILSMVPTQAQSEPKDLDLACDIASSIEMAQTKTRVRTH
jgi:hypothetical protein